MFDIVIKILSHLPEAMICIRVLHNESLKEITEETFNNHKNELISKFQQYPEDILVCIDNYVSNNIKINSKELVKLVLTQPI